MLKHAGQLRLLRGGVVLEVFGAGRSGEGGGRREIVCGSQWSSDSWHGGLACEEVGEDPRHERVARTGVLSGQDGRRFPHPLQQSNNGSVTELLDEFVGTG